jgi:fatty acid CoA ligase FadD9
MILAHSRYVGQINVPDMFTRWLFSLIVSGIAPRSFYEGNPTRAARFRALSGVNS